MPLTDEQRDKQVDTWIKAAPARAALQEARQQLLNAASIFAGLGLRHYAERYQALARDLPSQGR